MAALSNVASLPQETQTNKDERSRKRNKSEKERRKDKKRSLRDGMKKTPDFPNFQVLNFGALEFRIFLTDSFFNLICYTCKSGNLVGMISQNLAEIALPDRTSHKIWGYANFELLVDRFCGSRVAICSVWLSAQ